MKRILQGIGKREDLKRALAVLFYAISSILIMLVNKIALFTYKFPDPNFLALSQFLCTATVLPLLKSFGIISYPDITINKLKGVFPLPFFFLGNTSTGERVSLFIMNIYN